MTIQQMRYYYEVCRLQNITQAAAILHIAQSTLSQSMKQLEQETGMNLFHRSGRNILISQDGQKLYRRISQLLQEIDRFDDDVRELSRSHNHIKAAIPPQLATQLLPVLLTDFPRQHPGLELDIVEPSGAEAARMVTDEEVDLAVINLDEEKHPSLNYHRLSEKPICLAVWPDHPLANQQQVTFEEAAAEPLIMLGQEFFVTRKILREFARRSLSPEILYYSDNLSTIISLLQHHTAPAILSSQALSAQVQELCLIPFAEPQKLTTCVVTKKSRQIYHHQRLLMDFLKKLKHHP